MIFALRQTHAVGGGLLRTGVIRHCHIIVCYTQVIMLTSPDAFPVVGGRCTGRALRCKARQDRHSKTALMFEYLIPQ
jgi:hypothetical protein